MNDRPPRGRHRSRPLLLSIACALIVASAGVALFSVSTMRTANVQVERLLDEMLVLKRIEDLVEGSGADQRLYRLYHDPGYLASYRKARAELPDAFRQLRGLTAGDDTHARQFDRLETLIAEDSAALATSVEQIEPSGGPGAVPAPVAAELARTKAL